MSYLLAIDTGTSGTKVLIVDATGQEFGRAAHSYGIHIPHPDYAEQSPEEWWEAAVFGIRSALSASGIDPAQIAGVGLTGQMHGLVPLDRAGRPVRDAIIWADRRSVEQAERINRLAEEQGWTRRLLNRCSPGFLLPSLLWMKENEPERYADIHCVMTPKDYVRYRLTGVMATDLSDASATLACDLVSGQWCGELLERLGINAGWFPPILPSAQVAGEITSAAAGETGLRAGTPVVAGAGDHPAQLLGNGIIRPGTLSVNIGSGSQVSLVVEHPFADPKLRTNTFCHAEPGKWAIAGAGLNGGICLKWLNENVFPEMTLDGMNEWAGKAEPGANGLVFLPYLSGERSPIHDPKARGVLFGLTLEHDRSAIIRAVMEGVVLALRDSLDVLAELAARPHQAIASGGAAKSALWRQIMADVLEMPIRLTTTTEEACMGAIILAAKGVGLYGSTADAICNMVRIDTEETPPDADRVLRYRDVFGVYRSIYRQNKPIF